MNTINWRHVVKIGLILGVVVLITSVIGMVQAFDERDLVEGIFTLGQLLLFAPAVYAGYAAAGKKERHAALPTLLAGLLAGALVALPPIGLVALATVWTTIRDYFVNVSPQLIEILTFGRGPLTGSLILLGVMAVLGLLGAAIHLAPLRLRRPILNATLITLLVSVFSGVPLNILNNFLERSTVRLFFPTNGLTVLATVLVFVLTFVWIVVWDAFVKPWRDRRRAAELGGAVSGMRRANSRLFYLPGLVLALLVWLGQPPVLALAGFVLALILIGVYFAILTPKEQSHTRGGFFVLVVGQLLTLPRVLGIFLSNVIDQVATFLLMALGLNIVVGFAGLLDLGYVAFFAVGAYVTALLTSTGELGFGMNFWIAMPIGVAAAVIAGVILGIPVLRLRGDYLAIVTLGFGEIIRVLVRSDLLKPIIGGAQGILDVGQPGIGNFQITTPEHYYYLMLAACALALFIAWRLRDGRPGRRWMAMREDEDVAEAVGIHLVSNKLLAFAIGAAFAGLSGAIFGSRVGSVFPNSFELLISINVLAIIIVGGVGSLPGVVLGAFVLVGLPELLREFAEFRLLIYGVLLIVMMLVRPEGLWPSSVRQRELHAGDEEAGRQSPLTETTLTEEAHSLA